MDGFRQCKLEKEAGIYSQVRVSWIPEPFGRVGKVLRLRERGGEWDDGWRVVEAGELRPDAPEYRSLFVTCPELRRGS